MFRRLLVLTCALVAAEGPAAAVKIPAGYAVMTPAINCSDSNDDYRALQKLFHNVPPRTVIRLPAGNCLLSRHVVLSGKADVANCRGRPRCDHSFCYQS